MRNVGAPGNGCIRRPDAVQPRPLARRASLLALCLCLAVPLALALPEDDDVTAPPAEWLARAIAALARPGVTGELAAEDAILATRESEALAAAADLVGEDEQGALARFEALSAAALDPLVARLANLTLGELLLRAGEPRRAAAALAHAPRDPRPEAVWRRQMLEGAARAEAGDRAEAGRLLLAAGEGARLELADARGSDRSKLIDARRLALRWAGWLAAQEGDYGAARGLWHRALGETRPPAATADSLRLAIAASWFAEGEWDSIRAAGSSPRLIEWDYLLGWARFAGGEQAAADSAFTRLVAAGDRVPAAWVDQVSLAQGWMASRRGDARAALAHYARIRDDGAIDGGAGALRRYGEAIARLQAGETQAAAELLATPPSGESAAGLLDLWALARAHALTRLDRADEALAGLERFQGRAGGDSLARVATVLRGDIHLGRGEVEGAYALYTSAASTLDDPPESLRRRVALAALGAGRWGAAARELADLQLKFPATRRSGEYAFWRGEALYQLGRTAEARDLFARAERLGVDRVRCAYALGWCACDEGRHDLALELFERAARGCARCELADDLQLGRAYCLARLGRLAAADREIARLCERWEQSAADEAQSGEAADTLGVTDDSLAASSGSPAAPGPGYRGAVARFVEVARTEVASPLGAYALTWAGEILEQAGRSCEAVELLRRAAQHAGAGDTLRARILVARAGAARLCGGVASAAADYREALESGLLGADDRRAVYIALILGQAQAGDWGGAQAALAAMEQENLRGGAELSEARLSLAAALAAAGRADEALRCYDDWLGEQGSGERADEVRLRRAELIEAGGDWEAALREYSILADTGSPATRSAALERAGLLHLQRRQDHPALDAFRRRMALDLAPAEAAETRARMAAIHERQGERAAASNEWEKIAHAGPQVPDSLRALGSYQLGRIALEAGDAASAAREFGFADSLGFGPEARRWLEEAQRRLGGGR